MVSEPVSTPGAVGAFSSQLHAEVSGPEGGLPGLFLHGSGSSAELMRDTGATLVGPTQTAPIREGLRAEGYPSEHVKMIPSLFGVQDLLKPLLREGDADLYENDLPDHHDEAKG